MAKKQDEHLTNEQLSASFDKQLSPQEQAVFDAHIATCQQCQMKLSDVRLTAALLHALPEEEVPHTFVLPGSLSNIPNRTIRQDAPYTTIPQRHRTQKSILRRSIRVVSTLAAVLALCFIISGILPLVYSGVGNSASTTASSNTSGSVHPTVTTPGVQQSNGVIPPKGATAAAPPTESAHSLSRTATATTPSNSDHSTNPGQSPVIQPTIDLSQPVKRVGIGVVVFAVSIIGLIITRRRRFAVH